MPGIPEQHFCEEVPVQLFWYVRSACRAAKPRPAPVHLDRNSQTNFILKLFCAYCIVSCAVLGPPRSAICLDVQSDPLITECQHSFCAGTPARSQPSDCP